MIVNITKVSSSTTNAILATGEYNGKVVDNADPKNIGRIKVQVYGITDKIEAELLPWYQCIYPVNASPNAQGGVPPIGSDVVVHFPDNSIYNGIVKYMTISIPPK